MFGEKCPKIVKKSVPKKCPKNVKKSVKKADPIYAALREESAGKCLLKKRSAVKI